MAIFNVTNGTRTVRGTEEKDEINVVTSVGNGIIIEAGAGNDIIKVTRGDNHRIKAGDGDDIIEVAGGRNYIIDLGAGDDKITLWGNSGHDVRASLGFNTVSINSGSNYKITGTGTGTSISGTVKLIIKGNNSNNKAYLGNGNDFIGIAAGAGNELHAGYGDDQIIVSGTGGEGNTIYGDAGNDKIKLYSGKNNKIDAGLGNDAIVLTGASYNEVSGGSGQNQIIIMGGIGNSYTGGNTKDNITIKNTADSVTVNAGTGATVVNIQAGNNHVINLSKGDSVTQILAGNNIRVNGIEGKDTLRTWGTVSGLKADLGAGNDKIKVYGGNKQEIKGGAGDDYFEITPGDYANTDNSFYGDADNDKMLVRGGAEAMFTRNTFDGGAGNDTITVTTQGTIGCIFKGGSGDDTLEVFGERNKLEGGEGNDKYILDWSKCGDGNVIIQTSANQNDEDYLEIKNASARDFTYTFSNNVLTLTHIASKKTLKIEGWGNGLNSIVVGDRRINQWYMIGSGVEGGLIEVYEPNSLISTANGDNIVRVYSKNNEIETGTGRDTVEIAKGADDNLLWTGAGQDTIVINGSNNKVFTEGGNDIVNIGYEDGNNVSAVANPSNNVVSLSSGNNTIYIYAGKGNHIISGNGYDTVEVYGGSEHVIETGAGSDEIYISAGDKITVKGGAGNDYFDFGQMTNNAVYTIDQTSALATDRDEIRLEEYDKNSFSIVATGQNSLKLTHKTKGMVINVLGYSETNTSIYFGEDNVPVKVAALQLMTMDFEEATFVSGEADLNSYGLDDEKILPIISSENR